MYKTRHSILVVDDDVNMAKSIARTLKNEGYAAWSVSSGHEAEVTLEHYKPDLITLDLRMPEVNGFSVFRAIKNIEGLKDTKFLMVSGEGKKIKHLLLELGIDDYLEKPFDNDKLLCKVSKLLE